MLQNQAEIQKAEKIKISGLDIYNNSKGVFNQREMDLLSLGLNFGITPKKIPLIENISETEKLSSLSKRLETLTSRRDWRP